MQALLGTRLVADINLVAQVGLLIGLWIGFYYARTQQIAKHTTMQTTMVLGNLVFIVFVMAPSFYQYVVLGGTTGGIVAQLMLLHGCLGLIAQLGGLYLVARMRTQLIPLRFRIRNFKLLMRVTLALWTVIFLLGIGIYYYRYLVARPAAAVTGSLVQFREAGENLVVEAEQFRSAVSAGDTQAARRAGERLVNLIEGRAGAHFGDVDKNGLAEDPGGKIGLLGYLQAVKSAAQDPGVSARVEEVKGWLETIRDQALAVTAATDLGSVGAMVEKALLFAERAQREGIASIVAGAPPLVIVVMDEFAFHPPKVTVHRGTTIVWINHEPEVHTITADDDRFDSGDVDRSGAFSVVFTEKGTFPYYCIFHGDQGGVDMAGTVVVE